MGSVALELPGHHHIGGQQDHSAMRLGGGHDLARGFQMVRLIKRLAHLDALRRQEGVGHGAADHQGLHPADQVFQQVNLCGDLGAADDRHHRAFGMGQRLFQMGQLGLHGAAGGIGQQPRHAFGAGMGTVRGAEGVVDEDVAQLRQGGRHGGIVLFLTRMKAGVFQQQHVAVLQRGDGSFGDGADAVIGEGDLAAHGVRQRMHQHLQRHGGHDLALGAVEVAEHHNPRALVGEFANGRCLPLDAGGVGDDTILHRHVQVGANEHALAGNGEVIKSFEGHDFTRSNLN